MIFSMMFQKFIGPDMFDWIRHCCMAEVCTLLSAFRVLNVFLFFQFTLWIFSSIWQLYLFLNSGCFPAKMASTKVKSKYRTKSKYWQISVCMSEPYKN